MHVVFTLCLTVLPVQIIAEVINALTGSSNGYNQLNHDTRYLVSVSASNGINIALFYEQRPDHNDPYNPSHDYRIYNITVRENLTGTLNTIKKYNFKYGVAMRYDNVPLHIYRYFLDTLENESIDGSGIKEKYVFEYYNRSHLGYRDDTWGWDMFGYQCQVATWYSGWNYYLVDSSHIDTEATRLYYQNMGYSDPDKYPQSNRCTYWHVNEGHISNRWLSEILLRT